MVQLYNNGAYLLNGTEIIEDNSEANAKLATKLGANVISKDKAATGTIAYGILEKHNTSGNMDKLKIKFDKLT